MKKLGGEDVIEGKIIVRKRGKKWNKGENVGIGKEKNIFEKVKG